ncbi:MAG: hypothetical protein GXO49_04120 [Chlorobi bacterium]|nr:hypothetical protein [Chlorobiota bacterium]
MDQLTYKEIKSAIEDKHYIMRGVDFISPYGNKITIEDSDAVFKIGKLVYYPNLDRLIEKIQREYGYDKILLKYYKSNGTTWKSPKTVEVNMLPQMQQNQIAMQPNNEQIPQAPQMHQTYGMNGSGMNAPENIYKIFRFDEVNAERKELKKKYEECKEAKSKLEIDIKLLKAEQDKKSIWESPAIEKISEMVPGIISKVASEQQTVGLNNPNTQKPALQHFC